MAMNGRRQSHSGGAVVHTSVLVENALKACDLVLETKANSIKSTFRSKFPKDKVDEWSKKIITLACDASKTLRELELTNEECQKICANLTSRNGVDVDVSEDPKKIINTVAAAVKKRMQTYDKENEDIVKRLRNILKEVCTRKSTKFNHRCNSSLDRTLVTANWNYWIPPKMTKPKDVLFHFRK